MKKEKKGEKEAILKITKKMKDFGDDFDFISKRTGLSVEEIEKI